MYDKVEQLEIRRRRVLITTLLAILAWRIPELARHNLATDWSQSLRVILGTGAFLGALAWIASSISLWRFLRDLKRNPDAAEVLNDERFRALQSGSRVVGFWMLAGYMVLIFVGSTYSLPLDPRLIGEIGILVAACGPMAWLLFKDRGDG